MKEFPPGFSIAGRRLGAGNPCYVIAEAGSNHDRRLEQALRLVDVAVSAGADAVKFQTFSPDGLYSRHTPMIGYLQEKGLLGEGETVHDLVGRISMPWQWHEQLARYCRERSITFLSTPFEEAAVDELERVGVAAYKVASFEIGHLPLLRLIGQTGKPVLLSTGMAGLGDIERALETLQAAGCRELALLHCAIGYPPRFEDVHLRALDTLRRAFGCPVGFSDHTMGSTVPVAAVALGADVIEKHFTLDRTLPGPDHPFSMEPEQLRQMVADIRNCQQALGRSLKWRTDAEEELYRKARRSLVARVPIARGTVIQAEMLAVKRPGTGVPPHLSDWIIGRPARRDIAVDEVIQADMV